LSRSNTLDPVVKAQLRTQALALGLPFDRLIWVEHQR